MVKERRSLSKVQKTILVDRYQQGVRACHLAKAFKVRKQTVSKILKRFAATGTVERAVGSGRPRKTSPLEDRLIVRTMKTIMVWGAFAAHGVGKIYKVPGFISACNKQRFLTFVCCL